MINRKLNCNWFFG